jgi:hypothetical protein
MSAEPHDYLKKIAPSLPTAIKLEADRPVAADHSKADVRILQNKNGGSVKKVNEGLGLCLSREKEN